MTPPDTVDVAPTSGITCLYQDDDLLVLAKPPGLLCVPGRGAAGRDCLSARVQQRYPEALIVHIEQECRARRPSTAGT